MPNLIAYPLAILLAYLLGSIPVGLLVVKLITGEDIRTYGSGRTGGTNAMRAGGIKSGLLTALGDITKGALAVILSRLIAPGQPWLEALSAVAAVAGHNWSVYLKFKGGAGTGPNVGAAIALWPVTGLIMIPFVPAVLYLTGYASVTSTLSAVLLIILFAMRYFFAGQPLQYIIYAILTTILVAVALLPNYKRLIDGSERRIGPRAKKADLPANQ